MATGPRRDERGERGGNVAAAPEPEREFGGVPLAEAVWCAMARRVVEPGVARCVVCVALWQLGPTGIDRAGKA